jgi:hypothetical protein
VHPEALRKKLAIPDTLWRPNAFRMLGNWVACFRTSCFSVWTWFHFIFIEEYSLLIVQYNCTTVRFSNCTDPPPPPRCTQKPYCGTKYNCTIVLPLNSTAPPPHTLCTQQSLNSTQYYQYTVLQSNCTTPPPGTGTNHAPRGC